MKLRLTQAKLVPPLDMLTTITVLQCVYCYYQTCCPYLSFHAVLIFSLQAGGALTDVYDIQVRDNRTLDEQTLVAWGALPIMVTQNDVMRINTGKCRVNDIMCISMGKRRVNDVVSISTGEWRVNNVIYIKTGKWRVNDVMHISIRVSRESEQFYAYQHRYMEGTRCYAH